MVFELLGQSVFDFLKDNLYYPFPLSQIHSFAKQILNSISCKFFLVFPARQPCSHTLFPLP